MKFFSGFSLSGESYLFEEFIEKSELSVCGFSYGAIAALEYTLTSLNESRRVDRLQLFSPAFFQTKEHKFKRVQLMSYKKSKLLYLKSFLKSCFAPYEMKIVEQNEGTYSELEELLHYEWPEDKLRFLLKEGVRIEVYLGGADQIIDVSAAYDFFKEFATVTYIKDANHFLQLQ